jgi:hypothetical protein
MVWTERNAYRAEHLLIWEGAHGPIPKGHHVHHINGIRDDNRLENLICLTRSQHKSLHQRQPGFYHEHISDAELIRAYRGLWERLGHAPRTKECGAKNGTPTWAPYHRRFSTVRHVRELAHP